MSHVVTISKCAEIVIAALGSMVHLLALLNTCLASLCSWVDVCVVLSCQPRVTVTSCFVYTC